VEGGEVAQTMYAHVSKCKNDKNFLKDLFNEIYISLKREIEEDFRRWKDLSCPVINRINIVKMSILPKQSLSKFQ
jgi:hypothetical protein